MKLINLIFDIFNVFSKAHDIRMDEERRKKSVGFAVSAIIYSLLMIVCTTAGAFLLTLADSSLLFIFLLVIGLGLLVGAVVEFIGALLRVIVQFTLNRGVMSWIALVVFIASVIATVLLVTQFFG